jgi:hypothetical protein
VNEALLGEMAAMAAMQKEMRDQMAAIFKEVRGEK